MSNNLLNAILAMDSYNRGYNAAIKFGLSSDNADSAINGLTKIGSSTVYLVKGDSEAQDIGFYGIAYQVGNEVTRYGTDDGLLSKDFLSGVTPSAGI